MASSDIAYCDQCGGASPRRAAVCRFCGASLPPPRASVNPDAAAGLGGRGGAGHGPAGRPAGDDDPWADLHEPDPVAGGDHAEPWADPSQLPWRDEPDPRLPPTEVGAWQAATPVPPVFAAPPDGGTREEPTRVHEAWDDAALIEPGVDGPRRGLPGWAWVASVVLLGTLLGVGAYIVVDKADDGSVRTDDSTTTSTSSSTTSTSTTTIATTVPLTTVPVVPATPPVTPPDSGPPTVPGAVTTPTTLPPTTVATTPAPTTPPPTPAPTTPAPTTAAPTTPAPTEAPTTAPTPGTVPGDLGIPGIPMSQPPCDGQYVTILASAKNTTASAMQQALESFPGSHYLRTDQTCPSLNAPASDGTPLYRIYVGPYANVADACAARSMGTQGSFVKRLSTTDPPTHVVTCP